MLRTQVRLTEEQHEALKGLASDQHVSVAKLIRQAVDDLLRQSSILSRAEMKRRALAAAGRFRSGVKDLSNRHDNYLAKIDGE
jgi:Ribbon-helix-helix domain